jgi:cytochrome P450
VTTTKEPRSKPKAGEFAGSGTKRQELLMEGRVKDWTTANIYNDASLVYDYLTYYKDLQSRCPIFREPNYGMLVVTGHPEAVEIFQQGETFSMCQASGGALHPLPFEVEGDDIGEQIQEHRHKLPWSTHFITMDGEDHRKRRSIMTRLMTHSRLKRNNEYMQQVADRLIDRFIDNGNCEFISEFTQELGTLVIADLMGVPEEDRDGLVAAIGPSHGRVGDKDFKNSPNPLAWLDDRFGPYLEERRCEPATGDILSDLAHAKFPDGTLPDLDDLVRIASFTFVAGQDTSVKMMTWAMRYLCEYPELQDRLRAEPAKIPDFVEEVLRLQSPTKQTPRTAVKSTTIGGMEVPAGTMMLLAHCAANRDPRVFENPDELNIDRPNVREHLSFARGAHGCPGAPLARMEGRIAVERCLARMKDLRISEEHHGPASARRFERQETYVLNGLIELNIEFSPHTDGKGADLSEQAQSA